MKKTSAAGFIVMIIGIGGLLLAKNALACTTYTVCVCKGTQPCYNETVKKDCGTDSGSEKSSEKSSKKGKR